MNRRIRILSIVITLVITTTAFFTGVGVSASKDVFQPLTGADEYTVCLEKDGVQLALNTEKGNFKIYDTSTGLTFYSNPADVLTNPNLKGAPRTLAQSQIALVLMDIQGNKLIINSLVESVNRGGFKAYKGTDGVKCVYNFPNYEIEIPVVYSIKNGRLVVSISSDDVKSKDTDMYLSEIRVLPYFGAADVNDEGMFIVPDGSGSIIRFNSRITPMYEQAIYGLDRGKSVTQLTAESKPALLPMMAASYTNCNGTSAGLVTYVEEGDSLARAYADAASSDKCYNVAYFGFIYRNNDVVTLMDQTSEASNVTMSEKSAVSDCKFTVSYTILDSEQSSIVGIANAVRERVFDGKIPEKVKNTELPVYIQAYMSVFKTKYFLGVPYKGNLKLTDVEDCKDMIESFADMPVILSMRGLDKDGAAGGKIDNSFTLKRSIATYKEFEALTKMAEKSGGKVYPYAEFTEFTKGNRNNRVLSVANLTVKHPFFNYGTKAIREEYAPLYILKSDCISENVSKWIKSAKKHNVSSCAPLTISNSPYRSGGGKGEDRNATQKVFEGVLKNFSKKNIDLLLESASAYAIPYADHIRALPIASSGFAACNNDIPFIQMVLHGIKSYSIPSVNFSGNEKKMLLKAIETGSSLDYTFTACGYSSLKETSLDSLNGSDYSLWRNIAPKQANELSEIMRGTVNAYITDYRIITDTVRVVVYENGSCFIVNYGDDEFAYNGITIEPLGYKKVDKEVLG